MNRCEPLYRKENTKAHGNHHNSGKDYSTDRQMINREEPPIKQAGMHGKKLRGLDYTPLFKYLVSNVDRPWNEVYSEVIKRLPSKEPIFWIVAKAEHEKKEIVRIGESTYYNGLYIDEESFLRKVNPNIRNEDLVPLCSCCTYTFNGELLKNKYREDSE